MGALGRKSGVRENKQGMRIPSERLESGQVVGRTHMGTPLSISFWSHLGSLCDLMVLTYLSVVRTS